MRQGALITFASKALLKSRLWKEAKAISANFMRIAINLIVSSQRIRTDFECDTLIVHAFTGHRVKYNEVSLMDTREVWPNRRFDLFTFHIVHIVHIVRIFWQKTASSERTSECIEEEKTISAKILLTRFRRTNKWMSTHWSRWNRFVELKNCYRMRPPTIRIRKLHPAKHNGVPTQCNVQIFVQLYHFTDDGYVSADEPQCFFLIVWCIHKKLCFHWEWRTKKGNALSTGVACLFVAIFRPIPKMSDYVNSNFQWWIINSLLYKLKNKHLL